jgi:hypothetical protein
VGAYRNHGDEAGRVIIGKVLTTGRLLKPSLTKSRRSSRGGEVAAAAPCLPEASVGNFKSEEGLQG